MQKKITKISWLWLRYRESNCLWNKLVNLHQHYYLTSQSLPYKNPVRVVGEKRIGCKKYLILWKEEVIRWRKDMWEYYKKYWQNKTSKVIDAIEATSKKEDKWVAFLQGVCLSISCIYIISMLYIIFISYSLMTIFGNSKLLWSGSIFPSQKSSSIGLIMLSEWLVARE